MIQLATTINEIRNLMGQMRWPLCGGWPCVRCSRVVRSWTTDRTSCVEGLMRCLGLHGFSFRTPTTTLWRGGDGATQTVPRPGTLQALRKRTSRRGATKRVDCAGVLLAAKSRSRLDLNPGAESCSRQAALVVLLRDPGMQNGMGGSSI